MNWTKLYLNTPIPEIPKILNNNFSSFKSYIDIFYDGSVGILKVPLQTTGLVKGARGEFVTAVVDNLTVKSQYTNLYENYTTADADFVTFYNDVSTGTRAASSDSSTNLIWPFEPSTHQWVDIETPYVKITNDASYGFQNDNLGQEFSVLFDASINTVSPYTLMLESSVGGSVNLTIPAADASIAWMKLITVAYDNSIGPKWVVKEFGGTTYSIA